MIVKIQRPLFSTVENPPWLVYNEDRSFERLFLPSQMKATNLLTFDDDGCSFADITVTGEDMTVNAAIKPSKWKG